MRNKTTQCSVVGCLNYTVGRGMCSGHYQRWKKHGTTMPLLPLSLSKPGKLNPHWKGGVISDGAGRIMVYCPGHPYPSRDGVYVLRYRLVMEKHLGRYLNPGEVIHHINEIPDDDRLENLELTSQSKHAKYHTTNRHKERRANEHKC